MSVTKQTEKAQLRDIILEASAYAKLHGLNMVAYMDNHLNDDSFDSVMHSSVDRAATFCVHLFNELPDIVQSDIMEPEIIHEPEQKVKWSLLWGLFTRYV